MGVIHYTYIDNSQWEEEAARRLEENRLRNERQQRELEEKQRIESDKREAAERERRQFLEKLEHQQRLEEEARQRKEEIKERERQRILELQVKAVAKRQDLFDYKFGSKTDLASFRGLDISDVNKLRIGVFGSTGSGKSCFINTCERVVRNADKGSVPIQSMGAEGTIILENFLQEMFFRLVDTRGFFNYDSDEGGEFSDILYGRLKPGDSIKRSTDDSTESNQPNISDTDAPFSDWIHGIILVVKANDPRLKQGALLNYLNPVRQIMRPRGISPVTVVTHRDTLRTPEECESALDLASAATGSSRSHTFFVANYCPANPGPNVDTELQIFDILHCAILTAERCVKIAKQEMKNRQEDQIQKAVEDADNGLPYDISPNASIEMFLNVLQCKYKWKESSINKVLSQLQDEDITTVELLTTNWSNVREMFPLRMRNTIQKLLKQDHTISFKWVLFILFLFIFFRSPALFLYFFISLFAYLFFT